MSRIIRKIQLTTSKTFETVHCYHKNNSLFDESVMKIFKYILDSDFEPSCARQLWQTCQKIEYNEY
jgi:hypothetical protein